MGFNKLHRKELFHFWIPLGTHLWKQLHVLYGKVPGGNPNGQ